MLRSVKLVTPEIALFVIVPLRVPPLGLFPTATVTEALDDVTVFPKLSRTVIVGGPGIGDPAVVFPG
jgi:hypothetical protein